MRIALGADHAGFALKQDVARLLEALGVAYDDFGATSDESVDYPDFAGPVARGVASGGYDYGILICGTGIGMAMAANKIAGARAAPACSVEAARLSREHNNANILALGARLTPQDLALDIVRVFLDTPFAGDRHARRVGKIAALEHKPG